MPSFLTISTACQSEYKELKSRFLSYAYPVSSLEDIKPIISDLKAKYFDARHHCYACRVGIGEQGIFKYSDDGEPSHTSGEKILAAIDSKQITNVLIVVVRYFGGIKLGAANLGKAYRQAALNVIEASNIVTQTLKDNIVFGFDFSIISQVNKFLKENNFSKQDAIFLNSNTIKITFDSDLKQQYINKLKTIYGLKIL